MKDRFPSTPAKANQAPNKAEELARLAKEVADAAKRRDDATTMRNIGGRPEDGGPNRPHRGAWIPLGETPLAVNERRGGSVRESLDAIIIAGDTMVGVSRTYTKAHPNDKVAKPYSVRLCILPFGANQTRRGSSFEVADIPLSRLEPLPYETAKPRSSSITYALGYAEVQHVTGASDPNMSSKHLNLTINHDGLVSVFDGDPSSAKTSLNGTEIVTGNDRQTLHGMDEAGAASVAALMQGFEEAPYTWDKASQGATVIEAQ